MDILEYSIRNLIKQYRNLQSIQERTEKAVQVFSMQSDIITDEMQKISSDRNIPPEKKIYILSDIVDKLSDVSKKLHSERKLLEEATKKYAFNVEKVIELFMDEKGYTRSEAQKAVHEKIKL